MRVVFASLLLLLGCDVVDLPVVDVPDAGGFQRPMGTPCANESECQPDELCEKPTCGDALGRCVRKPPFCDGDFRPECGCDGVTYWNGCLRRALGVEAAERGPCIGGLACDSTTPCPNGGYCARLRMPGQCFSTAAGECNVLPQTCLGATPNHFFACSGGPQCLDLCTAIRSEQPMVGEPGPCP